MTHAELVKRAARWLRNTQRCPVVLIEVHSHAHEIPDAIGFKADGSSIVVECKTSRADFLRERLKMARCLERVDSSWAMGMARWYLLLPGILLPDDDLGNWGVLEVRRRSLRKRVQAANLYRKPAPELALMVAAFRRRDRLFDTEEWPAPREEDVA